MGAAAPTVLLATAWFPPHEIGGTEVYVQGLAQGLSDLGWTPVVLVPRGPNDLVPYRHAGVEVIPYPRQQDVGAEAQHRWLADLFSKRPKAVYHQHSWTPDCGGQQLAWAKHADLPTVLTLHTPASLCLRGTMMRFGQSACSGKVEVAACAACWAQSRGAPKAIAQVLARAPISPLSAILPGRLRAAGSARTLAAARKADIVKMTGCADRLVAVCQWLVDALALNDVPMEKVSLNRQGVSDPFTAAARTRVVVAAAPYRLLYLGRWDPLKGIDTVVEALLAEPDLPLSLSVRAITNPAPAEATYRDRVQALAAGDPRISFDPPVARADLLALMGGYDALVIPSRWLETGPLVALEALSAGLFVLGSDIGGVAELVDRSAKGVLIRHGDVGAWRATLRQFARTGPPKGRPDGAVRTMGDAARETASLYAGLADPA